MRWTNEITPNKLCKQILWSRDFLREMCNAEFSTSFSKIELVPTILLRKLYIFKKKRKDVHEFAMYLQRVPLDLCLNKRLIMWTGCCIKMESQDPNLYLFLLLVFYRILKNFFKLGVIFLFCKQETKISTRFLSSQGRKLIRIKLGQLFELCGEKYKQFPGNSCREDDHC